MKNYMSSIKSLAIVLLLACAPPLFAQTWSGLGNGLGDGSCSTYVDALVVFGGQLYAGGKFTVPDGSGTQNIARWNGTSWTAVGGGVNGPVHALAALDQGLYVGGEFTTAGGTSGFNFIAKWNGTSWSPLGSGMNYYVWSLASKGTRVYAGGQFTSPGNRIAYWDTADSQWHAMGSGLGTGAQGVYAIAVTDDGTVYAGGDFAGAIFKYDGSTWTQLPDGPRASQPVVYALAAKGNDLYVGGIFTAVGPGPNPLPTRGIAKYSNSTWSNLPGEPWNPCDAAPNPGRVRAIAWNGSGEMFVTGLLANSQGGILNHIFAWRNGAWSLTVPAPPGLTSSCVDAGRALAVDLLAGKLYVGGAFANAGGVTPASANVAVWKPYTITELGTLGSYQSYGYGINNNTEITGNSQGLYPGLRRHAFRWVNGVMSELGTGASDESFGLGINDSSTIVGYTDYYLQGSYYATRGFRWTPAGGLVQLQTTFGINNWAGAVNGAGRIVGYGLNNYSKNRAIMWEAGSNTGQDMFSLDGSAPSKESYAFGINAAGHIVGKSVSPNSGPFHAYRTDQFDAIEAPDDLGTLGGTTSEAWAINNFDEVAGTSQITGDAANHAFLTKPGKKLTDPAPDNPHVIGALPGGNYAVANSVNNKGLVVGYSTSTGSTGNRAFLYFRKQPPMIDLNTKIDPALGWTLAVAYGVNDDGKIVGGGSKGGYTRAFLLDPTQ